LALWLLAAPVPARVALLELAQPAGLSVSWPRAPTPVLAVRAREPQRRAPLPVAVWGRVVPERMPAESGLLRMQVAANLAKSRGGWILLPQPLARWELWSVQAQSPLALPQL
jgi:hypothetical protein